MHAAVPGRRGPGHRCPCGGPVLIPSRFGPVSISAWLRTAVPEAHTWGQVRWGWMKTVPLGLFYKMHFYLKTDRSQETHSCGSWKWVSGQGFVRHRKTALQAPLLGKPAPPQAPPLSGTPKGLSLPPPSRVLGGHSAWWCSCQPSAGPTPQALGSSLSLLRGTDLAGPPP